MRHIRNWLLLGTPALGMLFLAGCGADYKRETASVSGTVTCDGVVLTEGWVIFSPIFDPKLHTKKTKGGGKEDFAKEARGQIQADGTYELSTYDEGDGAFIGKHEVRVMQLDPEDDEAPIEDQGYACGIQILELEVKDENNYLDLELTYQNQEE